MRKIPCLFKRDPADRRRFLPEHQFDLPADAVATVKWDGVAVKLDEAGCWWVRWTAKHGGAPTGSRFVQYDPATNMDVWWSPLDLNNDEHGWIFEAIAESPTATEPCTYEAIRPTSLCPHPHLIRHGSKVCPGVPTDYAGLRSWLADRTYMEGVVWWDAARTTPLAKVRRYDVGLSWKSSAGENPPGGRVPTPPPASDVSTSARVVGSPAEATITFPPGVNVADVHWEAGDRPGTIIATWTEWVE